MGFPSMSRSDQWSDAVKRIPKVVYSNRVSSGERVRFSVRCQPRGRTIRTAVCGFSLYFFPSGDSYSRVRLTARKRLICPCVQLRSERGRQATWSHLHIVLPGRRVRVLEISHEDLPFVKLPVTHQKEKKKEKMATTPTLAPEFRALITILADTGPRRIRQPKSHSHNSSEPESQNAKGKKKKQKGWTRRGSNPGPLECKSSALPLSYEPKSFGFVRPLRNPCIRSAGQANLSITQRNIPVISTLLSRRS